MTKREAAREALDNLIHVIAYTLTTAPERRALVDAFLVAHFPTPTLTREAVSDARGVLTAQANIAAVCGERDRVKRLLACASFLEAAEVTDV